MIIETIVGESVVGIGGIASIGVNVGIGAGDSVGFGVETGGGVLADGWVLIDVAANADSNRTMIIGKMSTVGPTVGLGVVVG